MGKKPNIILITTDQHHWSLLGKHTPYLKTPNLDELADEGILFTNAYCTDPTCTPSRASILTGKLPSEHGAWSLGTRLDPEKNQLFTTLLKKAHRGNVLFPIDRINLIDEARQKFRTGPDKSAGITN